MATPGAAVDDRAAIGAVVDAMYAMVSGPAGPRDWSHQSEVFHPDARQMRTGVEGGTPWIKIMTPQSYTADTEAFFEANDFFEVEIARRIDVRERPELTQPRSRETYARHGRLHGFQIRSVASRRPSRSWSGSSHVQAQLQVSRNRAPRGRDPRRRYRCVLVISLGSEHTVTSVAHPWFTRRTRGTACPSRQCRWRARPRCRCRRSSPSGSFRAVREGPRRH